jgi:hypothetical protein
MEISFMNKVPNSSLVEAALEMMDRNGRSLTRLPSKGRALIFRNEEGETVRIRTCNDHVLIGLAESADVAAPINIEGTDFLLIAMPETERTPGSVMVFIVPSEIAADAAREAYRGWLSRNPNTKGNNKTRNLWFDNEESEPGHGFLKLWTGYRLQDMGVKTSDHTVEDSDKSVTITDANRHSENAERNISESERALASTNAQNTPETLGQVIARARREIAKVAGILPENIHIKVELT